jgi:hypothetical protein
VDDHISRVTAFGHSKGAGRVEDLDERADDLLRRASALRQHCEHLGERLDAIARWMPDDAGPRPPDASEGIRLVATNLVLSGATREEVDARLRQEFGAADNEALLDEVFATTERPSGRTRRRRLVGKR